jgi:hypothetical protein
MARGGQPVVNGGPDLASLHRRFPGSCVTGDEQQDSLVRSKRSLQPKIDGVPSLVEAQTVEIEDPVGFDGSGSQLLVPAGIKRV